MLSRKRVPFLIADGVLVAAQLVFGFSRLPLVWCWFEVAEPTAVFAFAAIHFDGVPPRAARMLGSVGLAVAFLLGAGTGEVAQALRPILCSATLLVLADEDPELGRRMAGACVGALAFVLGGIGIAEGVRHERLIPVWFLELTGVIDRHTITELSSVSPTHSARVELTWGHWDRVTAGGVHGLRVDSGVKQEAAAKPGSAANAPGVVQEDALEMALDPGKNGVVSLYSVRRALWRRLRQPRRRILPRARHPLSPRRRGGAQRASGAREFPRRLRPGRVECVQLGEPDRPRNGRVTEKGTGYFSAPIGPRGKGTATFPPRLGSREQRSAAAIRGAPCLDWMDGPCDVAAMRFDTLAIHAGQKPDPTTGAIMTPVYLTSTYVQAGPGEHKGYEYSRTQNPTRHALEGCLAALEGAKFGAAFASGLAASDMLMHMLDSGDHVICSDDVYGGTFRLFDKVFKRQGLTFTFVDMSNPENITRAITPKTKVLWVETPTNPTLKLVDLAKVAEIAKAHQLVSICDNTFMSPYFQRPLEFGIDVVTHSTTKYINGHSDCVGGFVCTNDQELAQKMYFLQNAVGGVPSPMDSFLVLRGVKTLHVRMERHAQNAIQIAEFLAGHSQVAKVTYPGLTTHPQHALAKKQMKGFGGMMTFEIKGGLEAARKFLKSVQIFACAESLGGVESLIEHPAIMTHASIPKENREKLGISDGLIRLSVGIEDAQDLVDDLAQALKAAQ